MAQVFVMGSGKDKPKVYFKEDLEDLSKVQISLIDKKWNIGACAHINKDGIIARVDIGKNSSRVFAISRLPIDDETMIVYTSCRGVKEVPCNMAGRMAMSEKRQYQEDKAIIWLLGQSFKCGSVEVPRKIHKAKVIKVDYVYDPEEV